MGTPNQTLIPYEYVSNSVAAVTMGYEHFLYLKNDGELHQKECYWLS
jgi:hypothetical protein